MKKSLFFLVFFLICFSFSSAISISHNLENNIIIKEYPKELIFNLTAENALPGRYNVYSLSDVFIHPNRPFYLEQGETSFQKTFVIEPMNRLLERSGNYGMSYVLNYNWATKRHQRGITLQILSIADVIQIQSDVVDLNDEFIILNIINTHNQDFNNLSLSFSSILFEIKTNIDLDGLETIKLKIPISTEKLKTIKSGTYLIEGQILTPKGPVEITGNLYLTAKEDIITETDETGLIFKTITTTKFNTGNTIEDVQIQIQRNIFNNLFTSFNTQPIKTTRQGTKITYTWTKRLEPSQIFIVRARTNYFYPILILVVLILIIYATQKALKTRIILTKKVTPVKTKNGEFALRVSLIVSAKKDTKDISLVDRIPRIVKIYKNFGLSMPDEIDSVTRRLKWNIGDLKAGEERMYNYIVYSRVGFLGTLSLPKATARFKSNKRFTHIESNSIFYMADQKETNP